MAQDLANHKPVSPNPAPLHRLQRNGYLRLKGNEPNSKPYTGGCACGAVRYEIKAEPVFSNECQCRQCQQRSGAGHGSYMTFAGRADVNLSGRLTDWEIAGDSRSEEHTSELQSLMRISYAVFCLNKQTSPNRQSHIMHYRMTTVQQ